MAGKARVPQELPRLQEELLTQLRRRILDLLVAHDQCLHDLGEPHVHSLRLALRHLQPLLEVFHAMAFHKRAAHRINDRIRALLHLTGPLRDAQVRRIALLAELRTGALRSDLLRQVEREERALRRAAAAQLKMLDREDLIRLAANTSPKHTRTDAWHALHRTVVHRRSRLQQRIGKLRPDDPAALHKARIALKRYRYLVEAFVDHLPDLGQAQWSKLKRIQERLGTWHDERNMADWLLAVGEHLRPAPRKTCLALANTKVAQAALQHGRSVAALKRALPWIN